MPYVYAEFILQNRKSCQVNGFLATFLLYLLEGIWGTHLCKWKERVFWRLKVMYCYMKKTYDKASTLLIIPSVFSKSYVTRNLTLNAAYTSCLHQLNSYCLTFYSEPPPYQWHYNQIPWDTDPWMTRILSRDVCVWNRRLGIVMAINNLRDALQTATSL